MDLVSEYLSLKQAGRSYKGLCPFHPEKTPSFHVSREKQMFHCFGCHTGGDAITFLMKAEGISFPEALDRLAQRCGITINRASSPGENLKRSEKQMILEINQLAKRYFKENLWKGGDGLQYLKNRGLSDETIREFELGFAINSWDNLFLYIKRHFSTDSILKAGLICERQNGTGYYDRFRNRVIFPIQNIYGDICGFGARQIAPSEDGPKYLNSPETPVYSKGQILYGLYKAKGEIIQKKFVIVVEGYLDLITIYQAGFRNVVATLGTALTPSHVRILKRYTNDVLLMFDPDTAGQNAAFRGIDIFLEQEFHIKAALLPKGKDPDSFIREEGAVSFAQILKNTKNFIEFLMHINNLTESLSVQEKAKGLENIIPFLRKIKNPIEKEGYIHFISENTKVSEDALRERIRVSSNVKGIKAANKHFTANKGSCSKNIKRSAEGIIIRLALEMENPSEMMLQNLEEEDFKNKELRELATLIFTHWRRGETIEIKQFLMEIEDEEQKQIVSSFLMDTEAFDDPNKALIDCINKIKRERMNDKLKDIRSKLEKDSLTKSETDLLLNEYHRLKKECIFY